MMAHTYKDNRLENESSQQNQKALPKEDKEDKTEMGEILIGYQPPVTGASNDAADTQRGLHYDKVRATSMQGHVRPPFKSRCPASSEPNAPSNRSARSKQLPKALSKDIP
jgi:hypothetical protein